MKTETPASPWLLPSELGPCACSQLRRTARKLSSLYDRALAPCGLTITQYALLVNVGRAAPISRTGLAEHIGMDRTTLTRTLQPLERSKLIVGARSQDRRQHLLALSPGGRRKLAQAYVLWEQAQQRFTAQLGRPAVDQLRNILLTAEMAAEAATVIQVTA